MYKTIDSTVAYGKCLMPIWNSVPYACTKCQRSFKRPRTDYPNFPDMLTCPHCGASAYRMSVHFKAPRRTDDGQWRKVAALIAAGFRFERVGEPYPSTLAEVADFVSRHPRNSSD